MFHRNYGVGLAYNRFASNLDVTKSDFNGELKLGYSGSPDLSDRIVLSARRT